MPDEFYIGWEPSAPRHTGRHVRRVVIGLAAVVLFAVGFVAGRQGDFPPAVFAYGFDTTLVGVVQAVPVPRLRTQEGADILLVGEGKHGAHDLVSGMHGATVTVRGTPIHRGRHQGLEVHDLEARADAAPAVPNAPVSLGPVVVRGRIVDGKCWLGVMNPGDGKVHRGCAARCISGGAPALFAAEDGRVMVMVGLPAEALLPYVAEPVEVRGELLRDGDWLFLRTAEADLRRL